MMATRKRASFLVSVLGAFVMGGCLGVCGIHVPDWRFFPLMSVFILYGVVEHTVGWWKQEVTPQ